MYELEDEAAWVERSAVIRAGMFPPDPNAVCQLDTVRMTDDGVETRTAVLAGLMHDLTGPAYWIEHEDDHSPTGWLTVITQPSTGWQFNRGDDFEV
jgi:hypothetical protein